MKFVFSMWVFQFVFFRNFMLYDQDGSLICLKLQKKQRVCFR